MPLPEYDENTLNHLRRYADIALTAMENGADSPWQKDGKRNWAELGQVALALASLPAQDQEDYRIRLEALVDQFPEPHRAIPAMLYHASEGMRAATQEAMNGSAPENGWREAIPDEQWEDVRRVLAHSLIRYAQSLPATANSDTAQMVLLHARHADGWGLEDQQILDAIADVHKANGLADDPARMRSMEQVVGDQSFHIEALRYLVMAGSEEATQSAATVPEAPAEIAAGAAPASEEHAETVAEQPAKEAATAVEAVTERPAEDGAATADAAQTMQAAGAEVEDTKADLPKVESPAPVLAENAKEQASPQPTEKAAEAPLFSGNIQEPDLSAAMEGVPVFEPESRNSTTPRPVRPPIIPNVAEIIRREGTAPGFGDIPGATFPQGSPRGFGQGQMPAGGTTTIKMKKQPSNRPGMVESILQHMENRRRDMLPYKAMDREEKSPSWGEKITKLHANHRAKSITKSTFRDMESLQERIGKFQGDAHSVRAQVASDRQFMEAMVKSGADPVMAKERFKQQEDRHWERFFDANPQQRETLAQMENDAVRLDEKSRQTLAELKRMGNDGAPDRERLLAKMEALQEQSTDIPPSQPGGKSIHDLVKESVVRILAFLKRLFGRSTVEAVVVQPAAIQGQQADQASRRRPGI